MFNFKPKKIEGEEEEAAESAPSLLRKVTEAHLYQADPESLDVDFTGKCVLDRYQVYTLLKQGGHGRVYAGYDKFMKIPVSIKVSTSQLFSRGEIKLLPQVASKCDLVPRVIDFGVWVDESRLNKEGNPEVYFIIILQLLPGRPLRSYLDTWAQEAFELPASQAIQIMVDVLRAIKTCHEFNIVHFDVHPGNIIIDRVKSTEHRLFEDENDTSLKQGDEWNVWLIDFGLATSKAGELPRDFNHQYCSPEVTSRTRDRPHHLDDLYSVAAVLYEVVTQEISDDAQPPNYISSPAFNEKYRLQSKEIPAKLQSFLSRALDKDPKKRFQSAAEMLNALVVVHTAVLKQEQLEHSENEIERLAFEAVESWDVDALKKLYAEGGQKQLASIRDRAGNTLLHQLAKSCCVCIASGTSSKSKLSRRIKTLQYLLSTVKIDVDTRNLDGETPLYLASQMTRCYAMNHDAIDGSINDCISSAVDSVKLLLKNGANRFQVERRSRSPLHVAFCSQIADVLLWNTSVSEFKSADEKQRHKLLNMTDSQGYTALLTAMDSTPSSPHRMDLARLLISKFKASLTLPESTGKSRTDGHSIPHPISALVRNASYPDDLATNEKGVQSAELLMHVILTLPQLNQSTGRSHEETIRRILELDAQMHAVEAGTPLLRMWRMRHNLVKSLPEWVHHLTYSTTSKLLLGLLEPHRAHYDRNHVQRLLRKGAVLTESKEVDLPQVLDSFHKWWVFHFSYMSTSRLRKLLVRSEVSCEELVAKLHSRFNIQRSTLRCLVTRVISKDGDNVHINDMRAFLNRFGSWETCFHNVCDNEGVMCSWYHPLKEDISTTTQPWTFYIRHSNQDNAVTLVVFFPDKEGGGIKMQRERVKTELGKFVCRPLFGDKVFNSLHEVILGLEHVHHRYFSAIASTLFQEVRNGDFFVAEDSFPSFRRLSGEKESTFEGEDVSIAVLLRLLIMIRGLRLKYDRHGMPELGYIGRRSSTGKITVSSDTAPVDVMGAGSSSNNQVRNLWLSVLAEEGTTDYSSILDTAIRSPLKTNHWVVAFLLEHAHRAELDADMLRLGCGYLRPMVVERLLHGPSPLRPTSAALHAALRAPFLLFSTCRLEPQAHRQGEECPLSRMESITKLLVATRSSTHIESSKSLVNSLRPCKQLKQASDELSPLQVLIRGYNTFYREVYQSRPKLSRRVGFHHLTMVRQTIMMLLKHGASTSVIDRKDRWIFKSLLNTKMFVQEWKEHDGGSSSNLEIRGLREPLVDLEELDLKYWMLIVNPKMLHMDTDQLLQSLFEQDRNDPLRTVERHLSEALLAVAERGHFPAFQRIRKWAEVYRLPIESAARNCTVGDVSHSLLHVFIRCQHTSMDFWRELVDVGADLLKEEKAMVEFTAGKGRTQDDISVIMEACSRTKLAIVRSLVEDFAVNINKTSTARDTSALHHACITLRDACIGDDIGNASTAALPASMRSSSNETTSMKSTRKGEAIRTIRYLVSQGANCNLENNDMTSPLSILLQIPPRSLEQEKDVYFIIETLLSHGAQYHRRLLGKTGRKLLRSTYNLVTDLLHEAGETTGANNVLNATKTLRFGHSDGARNSTGDLDKKALPFSSSNHSSGAEDDSAPTSGRCGCLYTTREGAAKANVHVDPHNPYFRGKFFQKAVKVEWERTVRPWLLIQFTLYAAFLCIVVLSSLVWGHGRYPRETYFMADSMERIFVNEVIDFPISGEFDKTYDNVYNMDEVWMWLQGPLYNGVYFEGNRWRNDDGDVVNVPSARYINTYNRLITPVQLRQIRVDTEDCLWDRYQNGFSAPCIPKYGSDVARKQDIANLTSIPSSVSEAFQYTEGVSDSTEGIFSVYPSGGYVIELPRNATATSEILSTLKDNYWLDLNTRALLVEFVTHNADLDVLCLVRFTIEQSAAGSITTFFEFETFKTLRELLQESALMVLLQIIVIGFIAFYVFLEIVELCSKSQFSPLFFSSEYYINNYWTSIYNYIDWGLYFALVVLISLRFALFSRLQDLEDDLVGYSLTSAARPEFEDLSDLLLAEKYLTGIVFFIVCTKMVQYLRCSQSVSLFLLMLSRMVVEYLKYLGFLLVVILGFSASVFIVFGSGNEATRHFGYSFFNTIQSTLNSATSTPPTDNQYRIVGPIFVTLFNLGVALLLINLLIATLNDAYAEVQEKNGPSRWCYEQYKMINDFNSLFRRKKKSSNSVRRRATRHRLASASNDDQVDEPDAWAS